MAFRMDWDRGVTGHELTDLLLAYLVLTLAFTWQTRWGGPMAETFMVTSIAVGLGFVVHEMAHKFTAQRFGYFAEFRASLYGLLLTVFTAALGFVFAAPGAVVIGRKSSASPYAYRPDAYRYTREDDRYWEVYDTRTREQLYISISGVATNMLLVGAFLLVLFLAPAPVASSEVLQRIIYMGIYVNVFLAAFNLLPFGPLDGAKVLASSPAVFAALAAVVFGSFVWFCLMPQHIVELFYAAFAGL